MAQPPQAPVPPNNQPPYAQQPGQPYAQQPGQQYIQQPGAGSHPVTPQKPKKAWYKKWWVWLLGAIVLIALLTQLGGGSKPKASETTAGAPATATKAATTEAKKAKLTLDEGWVLDKTSNPYMAQITGYVSNNTDKAVTTLVLLTFDALDPNGANLGTCTASTNTIDAGGKWKFTATCMNKPEEIGSVRFKSVSGF